MKTNKPTILPALIFTAAALLLAGCGKPGPAESPASAKTATESADGKEYTPAAKTMMASLGKTIKDSRLVYYREVRAGRDYTVVEYENGAIKSEWNYYFFSTQSQESFKSIIGHQKPKPGDKDEAALWCRRQEQEPFKKNWQQYYDECKARKTLAVVE
jgi:predicted small lipoprotein YifL